MLYCAVSLFVNFQATEHLTVWFNTPFESRGRPPSFARRFREDERKSKEAPKSEARSESKSKHKSEFKC